MTALVGKVFTEVVFLF